MNLGCLALLCPVTPVLTVTDDIMENDMEMLLPNMCAGCINVCAVRSTVLPVTQINLLSSKKILALGKFSGIPNVVTQEESPSLDD